MRRRRFPERDIFDDFFRDFYDIEETFDRLFRALPEGAEEPLYYGFSMRIGPDGVPEIRTFGNVKPALTGELKAGTREPLTDVIVNQENNEVVIVSEFPGCKKEDIEINATDTSVEFKAESGDRKYHKNVPLKQEIDPESIKATFNNGVLEVKAKLKQQAKKGVKIDIE